MQPEFWHQRWADNQIGFHQHAPTPLLLKHWPALGIAPGAKVFVPLAGKSLDMAWFAAQGHRVLGGMRASIYNAMPEAGVQALADVMRDFQGRHG